jgi:uncharacterized protein YbjT (DUF2867 family)
MPGESAAAGRESKGSMYSTFMQYDEVLVTGGTGLPGGSVCRAIADRGYLPRLMVRLGSEGRIPGEIRQRCRVTLGDATVREAVEMAAQGTWAIVHLAGPWRESPKKGITFGEGHVHATRNILHAAGVWGIRRLIYGSVDGARPESPAAFLSAKGRSEELVKASDLDWTVFRPAPWYDLRDGRPRASAKELEDLAMAISQALPRQDTYRRVFGPEELDRLRNAA